MSDASLALQRAVLAALQGDLVLIADVSGIFDGPPARAAFPYVTIGPDLVTDASTKSTQGRAHRFAVSVWSSGDAVSLVKPAMARVEAAMAAMPATIDGHQLVTVNFLRSFMRRDVADGLIEGTCEFRALTQANG